MNIFNADYADLLKIDQSLYTKYVNQGSGRVCSLCHSSDIRNEPTLLQCSYCLKPILYGHRYFIDKSLTINCCKTCYCSLSSQSNKHSFILRQHREITYEPVDSILIHEWWCSGLPVIIVANGFILIACWFIHTFHLNNSLHVLLVLRTICWLQQIQNRKNLHFLLSVKWNNASWVVLSKVESSNSFTEREKRLHSRTTCFMKM